ncbi:MAG: hypothetical protein AB7O57_14375 [Hyphomicrobiaceae bacterium]
MPCVRIATGKWAVGIDKLIEAVQSALVSAFKIPERDRDVVLDLYDENRRTVSTGGVGALHMDRDHRHRRALDGGKVLPRSSPSTTISRPSACRAWRL